MVYIDAGVAAYCDSPAVKDAAVELSLYDIASGRMCKRRLPGTLSLSSNSAASPVLQFPLAWSLSGKRLSILFPNANIDSVGRIVFLVWADNDTSSFASKLQTDCANDGFPPSTAFTVTNGIAIYNEWHGRGSLFQPLSSIPFAFVNSCNQEEKHTIWYDIDGTNIVARFPFANANSSAWQPCATPVYFRWSEFQFAALYNEVLKHESIRGAAAKGSLDVPADSFSPFGSVRITGRRVMSDNPNADLPADADWLIWEKGIDGYRLSKIRDGRWSACLGVGCLAAPKTIVVNNDSNTVFLLYSIDVDKEDIKGSFAKIVKFLQSSDASTSVVEHWRKKDSPWGLQGPNAANLRRL